MNTNDCQAKKPVSVEIAVNGHTVIMVSRKVTGLDIKQAE